MDYADEYDRLDDEEYREDEREAALDDREELAREWWEQERWEIEEEKELAAIDAQEKADIAAYMKALQEDIASINAEAVEVEAKRLRNSPALELGQFDDPEYPGKMEPYEFRQHLGSHGGETQQFHYTHVVGFGELRVHVNHGIYNGRDMYVLDDPEGSILFRDPQKAIEKARLFATRSMEKEFREYSRMDQEDQHFWAREKRFPTWKVDPDDPLGLASDD